MDFLAPGVPPQCRPGTTAVPTRDHRNADLGPERHPVSEGCSLALPRGTLQQARGAMTSGFETIRMILTSCQSDSVQW